ncbi:DUF86 domain-containing protein [Collinsella aerofaciens]|nr:DUF86 domain-containing protein [Collinsella aerofaciens]
MLRLSPTLPSICALHFARALKRMRCVSMKRRKRDEELIGVILSDCETLARRIDYFDATENSFVSDRSEEGELAYDAIMSPVYRIAEDALHLSDEIQSAFPGYPWNDIGGFRNFVAHGYVAHGYREVDRSLAWKVIVDDIPELEKALRIFRQRQS